MKLIEPFELREKNLQVGIRKFLNKFLNGLISSLFYLKTQKKVPIGLKIMANFVDVQFSLVNSNKNNEFKIKFFA